MAPPIKVGLPGGLEGGWVGLEGLGLVLIVFGLGMVWFGLMGVWFGLVGVWFGLAKIEGVLCTPRARQEQKELQVQAPHPPEIFVCYTG